MVIVLSTKQLGGVYNAVIYEHKIEIFKVRHSDIYVDIFTILSYT